MQHVPEGEDDAHSEAIVTFAHSLVETLEGMEAQIKGQ